MTSMFADVDKPAARYAVTTAAPAVTTAGR